MKQILKAAVITLLVGGIIIGLVSAQPKSIDTNADIGVTPAATPTTHTPSTISSGSSPDLA